MNEVFLMKIAIAGGSGFIGSALTEELTKQGHEVFVLTRQNREATNGITYVQWLHSSNHPAKQLEGMDAFINLAGESINSRWTDKRKKQILNSRIDSTSEVLSIISRLQEKPKVLINASAIGIYGTSKTETFTEESSVIGNDFLAKTTRAWEDTAAQAKQFGIRTVFARFGVVLAREGGALPKMVLPYRMFAGGKVGSGKQWVSWIHIRDAVRMICFSLENENVRGPLNVTSPFPVNMDSFGKIIAQTINRPHWMPAPALALKLLLGEMSLLVLEGQKVLPEKSTTSDFEFLFPTLSVALDDIFK
jgi:uncharacterized protein (TIGR01777 family)